MSIRRLDQGHFEALLREHLSPSRPIRSPEFLRGRTRNLEDIRRALVSEGRHIFIYGDRGVGKTSLAQTAAFQHQSSEQNPVLLTCDPGSTFYRIIQDLAVGLSRTDPRAAMSTTSTKAVAGWPSLLSFEKQQSVEHGRIPDLGSINEAVGVVEFLARRHSSSPVVVVDEFERIMTPDQRMLFADFIKQIGDRSVPLKLIFCGVGSSLDQLLDAHHSCYRYLTMISLERLGIDGRVEIIESARAAFGLNMDDTTRYRIAMISDGFPQYVHAVCEKLFWEAFEDPALVSRISPAHFVRAIQASVRDIEPHLKKRYEKAVRKYNNDYEEVLWAVADDNLLKRRSTDIFKSYQRVMRMRDGREPLSREKFNTRMNRLKRDAHGAILTGNRAGWYEFTENIVRGYVRLRAEEQSVELDVDHPLLTRRTRFLPVAQ